ncbi:phytanoyl-CoA dioxygenase family protein [Pedobacter gandavensis]|uniref:phytanoyl-CoA dioxygenase family protein n=1 Tax=Pedobacter gandavensis TaxID=2679963 RepID=UPI002479DE57|nr:phytanoyl-CoA dioxygenase family protein [Pedobacter gandavensis]WGQ10944.1 phytanoyl-CoA dioxygenase family protein [Pedobacter gandavensis]
MKLNNSEIKHFNENGFVVIPEFYSNLQVKKMQKNADTLSCLPELSNSWMKYYENSFIDNNKILCRIENFINYNTFFKKLLNSRKLSNTLQSLFGAKPVLFKEKINYKLSGANSFTPHQDAPAYNMFKCKFHITVMICIDNCTEENGTIEFAKGKNREGIFPLNRNGEIVELDDLVYEPLILNEGDILIFDSYVPHQSKNNPSNYPRRAIFATYNNVNDGDFRNEYYALKRKHFPPDYERDANVNYNVNTPFNLGNPIK